MLNEIEIKKNVSSHFSKTKHEDPYAALIYVRVVIGFLQKLCRDKREPIILDIGCGTGTLETYAPAVGLDISKTRLALARRNLPLECVVADANALPLRDGQFDNVHFAATLMHIPDYKGAIREASRVLRRNGILILYEPNADYAWAASWNGQGPFYQAFSKRELEGFLKSQGLARIRSEYCLAGVPFLQGFLQRRMRWVLLLLEGLSIPWLAREIFLVASKKP